VYEGEQEGPHAVALHILGAAVKKVFLQYFPNPSKLRRGQEKDPYGVIKAWFAAGNTVDLLNDLSGKDYVAALQSVAGLKKVVENANIPESHQTVYMELVLNGLAEFEVLSKEYILNKWVFRDFLTGNIGDELDELG